MLQNLVRTTNDPSDNSLAIQGLLNHLAGTSGMEGVLGNMGETGESSGVVNEVRELLSRSLF